MGALKRTGRWSANGAGDAQVGNGAQRHIMKETRCPVLDPCAGGMNSLPVDNSSHRAFQRHASCLNPWILLLKTVIAWFQCSECLRSRGRFSRPDIPGLKDLPLNDATVLFRCYIVKYFRWVDMSGSVLSQRVCPVPTIRVVARAR